MRVCHFLPPAARGRFLLILCETLFFRQTFEMKPPKERHQTDREWVGGATPLFEKNAPWTLDEYNLALGKKKKVFLYFKKGFSTDKIEENENYKKVLKLREEIIKENKTLFKDYENIDQFINLVNTDLNHCLKEKKKNFSTTC
jgi:hypothetical protein